KLLITHGASCGIDHVSADAPSVTGDTVGVPGAPAVASSSPATALSEGYAVMSTALDNAGHNCNLITQAESLIMAKEHLIEQYGTLRFTIGTGCSGGSLVQQQVANAYPGIYQGILPQCSFPDSWSTGQQLAAYHFTRGYFEHPEKWGTGVVWTPDQQALGHGFAGLPISDVGAQFGLEALRDGAISPAQFVDLNDKIGGADIDLNYTHARSDATQPALRNVYRSGGVNETNNL